MKSKVVLAVLAMIGILALSAGAAHAAGGVPFPLTSFFVCHNINADAPSPEKRVDVGGSAFLNDLKNLTLGNAVFACVIAKLFPAGSGTEIDPTPVNGSINQDGIKCYSYTANDSRRPNTPGTPDSYTVIDQLFGVDPDVKVGQNLSVICAPANFNPNP